MNKRIRPVRTKGPSTKGFREDFYHTAQQYVSNEEITGNFQLSMRDDVSQCRHRVDSYLKKLTIART